MLFRSEEEEEELTGEALAEMDFEELEEVCDDKDLDTDPDDFDEDEIEKLRKAIAKELGLKLPAKKEATGSGSCHCPSYNRLFSCNKYRFEHPVSSR